jgi:hypothetical protein
MANDETKYKFLEFRSGGIKCLRCASLYNYTGCILHKDQYPKLTKNGAKVPICRYCKLECSTCGAEATTEHYAKKYFNLKHKIKVEVTNKPDVKPTTNELIKVLDLANAPYLDYYRRSVRAALNLAFSFDVGSQLAVSDIQDKLKDDVPMDISKVRMSLDKLSILFFLSLAIKLSGLGIYEEDIIKAEIERLFKPTLKLPIPRKTIPAKTEHEEE